MFFSEILLLRAWMPACNPPLGPRICLLDRGLRLLVGMAKGLGLGGHCRFYAQRKSIPQKPADVIEAQSQASR